MSELDRLFSQTDNEIKKMFPSKSTGKSKLITQQGKTRATCKYPGDIPVNNNAMIEYCEKSGSNMMFTNYSGLPTPIYLKNIDIEISLSANNIKLTSQDWINLRISFNEPQDIIYPHGLISLYPNQDVYKISLNLQNVVLNYLGWFILWMDLGSSNKQQINNATIGILASYTA